MTNDERLTLVVNLMRKEWMSTVGTSAYLEALELEAIRLSSEGAVESRLAETGGVEADEMVHGFLIDLRERLRSSKGAA